MGNARHIVVVDDACRGRESRQRVVESAGHASLTFASAEDSLPSRELDEARGVMGRIC